MKDKPILSLTVVTDDDTGMYRLNEHSFGWNGRLKEYLKWRGEG